LNFIGLSFPPLAAGKTTRLEESMPDDFILMSVTFLKCVGVFFVQPGFRIDVFTQPEQLGIGRRYAPPVIAGVNVDRRKALNGYCIADEIILKNFRIGRADAGNRAFTQILSKGIERDDRGGIFAAINSVL
jgi:hypothetical protein